MVADMVVDKKEEEKVSNMELDMVADMEVDKVTDKVANMVLDMVADININMEIQCGERVGQGGYLIGPKLFSTQRKAQKSGKWQKSLLKKGKESYVMRFQLNFSFLFWHGQDILQPV